jgi:hypothetical protein
LQCERTGWVERLNERAMGIGSRRHRTLPAQVPERNHGLAVANVVVQAAPERLPDLNFDRLSGVVLDGELESLPAIRNSRDNRESSIPR